MYAIVESRGRQYKVSPGEEVALDLLQAEPGQSYDFDKVLMLVDDDNNVTLEKDKLDKVKVTGMVTKSQKGPKVLVFKYKKRKDYHRKLGHRQSYTLIRIESIENPD